jgi:hypothetical protein
MTTTTTYRKVRFTSPTNGSTAGLVVTCYQDSQHSIESLSRLFPYSEAPKMRTLQVSQAYRTWEEAFDHEFFEGASNG